MKPGSVAKRDTEYERCGTANAFCAIEPKAGIHVTKITPTRSSAEFADLIESIANRYPEAQTIHLVMDNLSSHTRKALVERFGEQEGGALWNRFTVHYTPVHGSWLNQAELEVGLFSKQCLGKRRIGGIRILRAEARAWNRRINRERFKICSSARARSDLRSLGARLGLAFISIAVWSPTMKSTSKPEVERQ